MLKVKYRVWWRQILKEKKKKNQKPVFPEFKVKVPKKFSLIDTTSLVWCVLTAKVVYQIRKQQHGFQINKLFTCRLSYHFKLYYTEAKQGQK